MSEIKKKYNNFDMTLEECKLVLDALEIIVVDEVGKVKYITETILKFIEYFDHVDMTNAVGKYIQDIHPVSRIPSVLASGKAEEEWFYFSAGELDIARIKPFYKNGKLKGVIDYDLFTEEKDFRRFFDKVIKYSLDGYIDLSKSAKDFMKTHTESQTKYTVGDIIGNSLAIKRLRKEIYEIAESDTTVLITGETGCGKELIAHSLHGLSRRATSNFIKINCAAIPELLVESELFGYEKGTFTGANKDGKIGKFELANKGTIFLDEIDQLPFHIQPKLLRILQEKEIDRIGGDESIPISIRVIAATNKNLKKLVAEGKFREDLYYRLNVFEINVPPLRERKEDIPILADTYIHKLNNTLNLNVSGISEEAIEILKNYDWPGNIRELFNIIERGVNRCKEGALSTEHLEDFFINISKQNINKSTLDGPLEKIRDMAEKEAIIRALNICNGNKSNTAKLLKISRTALYEKILKFNINQ